MSHPFGSPQPVSKRTAMKTKARTKGLTPSTKNCLLCWCRLKIYRSPTWKCWLFSYVEHLTKAIYALFSLPKTIVMEWMWGTSTQGEMKKQLKQLFKVREQNSDMEIPGLCFLFFGGWWHILPIATKIRWRRNVRKSTPRGVFDFDLLPKIGNGHFFLVVVVVVVVVVVPRPIFCLQHC